MKHPSHVIVNQNNQQLGGKKKGTYTKKVTICGTFLYFRSGSGSDHFPLWPLWGLNGHKGGDASAEHFFSSRGNRDRRGTPSKVHMSQVTPPQGRTRSILRSEFSPWTLALLEGWINVSKIKRPHSQHERAGSGVEGEGDMWYWRICEICTIFLLIPTCGTERWKGSRGLQECVLASLYLLHYHLKSFHMLHISVFSFFGLKTIPL